MLLAAWGVWRIVLAWRRKREAASLGDALVASMGKDGEVDLKGQGRGDAAVLRKGMLEAIHTIKTSKLGLTRGAAASVLSAVVSQAWASSLHKADSAPCSVRARR